jgi:4-hydroxybenzoate polyprenyltransferase
VDGLLTLATIARVHITVLAALGTLTFGWLFTGESLGAVSGIAAFDWFVLNAIGRVEGTPERRTGLRVLSLVTICLSFGVFHAYEPTLTWVRVCFFLLGIFYHFPLLPGRVRLKQIYIVETVASSLGLTLTCVAYPLARSYWGFFGLPIGVDGMTVLIAIVFFFLFEMSYEIVEDLRELPTDSAARIESLPVVLGPELSITIAHQLMIFSALLLIVGWAAHFVPWRVLILAAGPLGQYAVHKQMLRRGVRGSDPVVIAWMGVAMLAVYHVWIWLSLPGLLE